MTTKDRRRKGVSKEKTTRPRSAQPKSQSLAVQLEQLQLHALQRAVTNPHVAAPADILALQRRYGNRAVAGLIQAQENAPQPSLTPLEQRTAAPEAELQARPLIQRQAEDDVDPEEIRLKPIQASAIQRDIIQRAWVGRRQLGSSFLNWMLGKPWVWRKRGNIFHWGMYHTHIWLEDQSTQPGQPFYDRGHGPHGLFSEPGRRGEYSHAIDDLDDATMRQAISDNDPSGAYSLLGGNNCQNWVARVLASYRARGGVGA